jgi:Holliday junction resolvase RusA-like endonuclease
MRIEFTVEGEARAKARHRGTTMFKCVKCGKVHRDFVKRCRQCGEQRIFPLGMTHKDDATRSFERRVLEALRAVYDGPPLEGALLIGYKAYRLVPKSFSKKKTLAALAGTVRPETKPDMDNIEKAIYDALEKVAYRNDSQLCGYLPDTGKYYGESARVEIVIRTIDHVDGEGIEEQQGEEKCRTQSREQGRLAGL